MRATLEAQKRLRANGVGDTNVPEKMESLALPRYPQQIEGPPSSSGKGDQKISTMMTKNPVYTTEGSDVIV